jgi:hypothetical protein
MNPLIVLLLTISAAICIAKPLSGDACGGVSPSSCWRRTARNDQIEMIIDTSSCRFQGIPMYFTSVTGGVGDYLLTGINAIYEPTNSSFAIYVGSTDGASADTLMQRSAQWNMNWFGFFPLGHN